MLITYTREKTASSAKNTVKTNIHMQKNEITKQIKNLSVKPKCEKG